MTPADKWKIRIVNFRDWLIVQLKGAAVKAALKKLLSTAALGGFKAWLIKFVVEELFEHVAEPVIRLAFRKGMLIYDKIDGNIKIKKVREAQNENNADEYWDTLSDI